MSFCVTSLVSIFISIKLWHNESTMLKQGYLEFVQLTLTENRPQRQTDAPETHFSELVSQGSMELFEVLEKYLWHDGLEPGIF